MLDVPFLKRLVMLNGLVPLSLLVWDAWHDQLGANKVNYAIHVTGVIALLFLVLSLVVTPLRQLTGWQTLIAYRRALGLYGFFYAIIHLILYVAFDRAGNLSSTFQELFTRRYLQVGLASILLMIPLAVTSTDWMIRRLGPKRWKLLHRLSYVAVALGGIHYFLLVKSDIRQPVAFLSVIGTLLVGRIGTKYLGKGKRAASMKAVSKPPALSGDAAVARLCFWKGQLRLAKIFQETPNVKTFRFVNPKGGPLPFDFQPGQYLNLKLTIDENIVPRSYTIASSPTRREYCEVTIKREPQGRASRYIHDQWKEGDNIEISAPAGKFHFTGLEVDEVVLIAGGVGITPVMSMLRYLTDLGWPGKIHFIFVTKTIVDYIFREELEYLRKRFSNLDLRVVLTRTGPTAHDRDCIGPGRLAKERLLEWVPNLRSLSAYLCGPGPMMEHTRSLLLEMGMPEAAIHTEAFSSPTSSDKSLSSSGVSAVLGAGAYSTSTSSSIHQLSIVGTSTTIPVEAGASVLEGAERSSVEIPFECRSGVCGQCKVRLYSGKVKMDQTYALTVKEKEQGWILACQAHLETDGAIRIA
jgi:glycine betaine catabolism B